jgi:hypothetical protein
LPAKSIVQPFADRASGQLAVDPVGAGRYVVRVPADLRELEALHKAYCKRHTGVGQSTLTEVLDDAWDIYFEAEVLQLGEGRAAPTPEQRELLVDVAKKYLSIMQAILGTTNEVETLELLEVRMAHNQVEGVTDTGYLPTQTTPLNSIDPFTAPNRAVYNWRKLASAALAHSRGQLLVVEPGSRARDQGQGQGIGFLARPTIMYSLVERERYRVLLGGGGFRAFDRRTGGAHPFIYRASDILDELGH